MNKSRLWLQMLGYCIALIITQPSQADPANWQRADYIADSFLEIAVNSHDPRIDPIIRKWPDSGILYRFVHELEDTQPHESLSELHLNHLHSITGLPIVSASANQAANLLIVFGREANLKNDLRQYFGVKSANMLQNNVCLGSFSTAGKGVIDHAVIIIPVDRARENAKLLDCIVEQLSQIMGLPNDSEKVFPSIFNDRSVDHLLSGLDYVMLKVLYDERLKPGMSLSKAAPLVNAIVDDLGNNGVIRLADQAVRNGGLYVYDL